MKRLNCEKEFLHYTLAKERIVKNWELENNKDRDQIVGTVIGDQVSQTRKKNKEEDERKVRDSTRSLNGLLALKKMKWSQRSDGGNVCWGKHTGRQDS